MSGVIFKPRASAIIEDSQTAKDIDPYFKPQLCGGFRPSKGGAHFTEWAK